MQPLLGSNEVAQYLGVSPATLRTWRSRNIGPANFKIGRKVVYNPEDLQNWLSEQRHTTARGDVA
ncbi:helix-turn-helix domain-containing protein [Corynebacterium sp. H128]|uniref:helix-turn-helix domain-containing protein n=1 Tax=Corynebacterium sp. H128 TaxID=3133427 RepID=UPI00309E6F07